MERRPGPAGDRRQVAGPDRSVAGRELRAGPREEPAHHPRPGLSARLARRQRVRPPAGGSDGLRRHGARRGARGRRHRCGPVPAAGGATTPRTTGRCAPTCGRSSSASPKVPVSRSREPGALAALVAARRHGPPRGIGPRHHRLRGRRPRAAAAVPRLGERDGRALRRSRPDALVEERLRRRRVGARADGELAHPRVRLPRRDHLPRRRLLRRAGQARTRANAICVHEEDYGILWKHVDLPSGRTEVRRSRRLVISSIATVGNYEYGFYWYFYLDGTCSSR